MTLRLGGDGAITGCTSLENPDLTVSGLTISGSFDAEKVLVASGTAAAPSYTFSGDTDNGLYYAGTNSIGLSTGGTNAILIDSAGNVGIGTSSPAGSLGVDGFAYFGNQSASGTTDGVLRIGESTSSMYIQTGTNTSTGSSADLVFSNMNAANEWMRIDTSGRLLVGTSSNNGTASLQARTTGSTADAGALTLVTVAAAGGDAPNSPYAVTRTVYGNACNSGTTETIRTLASREIAFIKIFYSWPSGSPHWKTGAYDYDGSTVSTTWFHESNAGHAFTLGVSGGVLTLTQSVGVTMNMVIEIEYIDSSGLD